MRDDKNLEVLECLNCGLVYLSSKAHINEKFYENSNMHKEFNFDKWKNDTEADDNRRYKFVKNLITNKRILDFGSGNAGFLSKAKNISSYVCGVELDDAVKPFYEKEKIHLFENISDTNKKFDVITAFHVLEHLSEPKIILEQMKKYLNENGKIIIEVPNANDALLSIYQSKAFSNFTYWSCHLYLYTQHTLSMLAKQAGFRIDFIKYIQRHPLSNHLYWLSKNKPGGHVEWGTFIDSPELNKAYENQLATLDATDTIIAKLSIE